MNKIIIVLAALTTCLLLPGTTSSAMDKGSKNAQASLETPIELTSGLAR